MIQRVSYFWILTRRPVWVLGVLAMVVGYHFLGALGFWIALVAYMLLHVLAGHLARDQAERQRLREMVERDELP